MKDKIIIFIIGVLIGAVISTGVFYIYTTNKEICSNTNMQMPGGNPPEMPSGQNNENGQPPEMPSEKDNQNSSN